ncbi:MAG: glycosyltransferase, partial [bacterium]
MKKIKDKLKLEVILENIVKSFEGILDKNAFKKSDKTKTIKVTQISKYYFPFSGGLEAVAKQISDVLPKNKFQVEIISCSINNQSSLEIIDNIPVERCASLFEFKSNPISLDFMWKLSKVKTDILNYHHPFIFAAIAHFIARPKYKKLVVTYHGDVIRQKYIIKLFNPVYNKFLEKADKIFVLSSEGI